MDFCRPAGLGRLAQAIARHESNEFAAANAARRAWAAALSCPDGQEQDRWIAEAARQEAAATAARRAQGLARSARYYGR